MTRFAGALQIFDIIYVTTNGGPNYTTESTVSYIYSRAVLIKLKYGICIGNVGGSFHYHHIHYRFDV